MILAIIALDFLSIFLDRIHPGSDSNSFNSGSKYNLTCSIVVRNISKTLQISNSGADFKVSLHGVSFSRYGINRACRVLLETIVEEVGINPWANLAMKYWILSIFCCIQLPIWVFFCRLERIFDVREWYHWIELMKI